MASTWGTNSWGDNSWQSNILTETLTGVSASFSLGTIASFPEQGWGRQQYGNSGWNVEYSVALEGLSASTSLGTVIGEEFVQADPTGLGASDEGSVYYNSTDNKLKVWDGTAWENAGGASVGTQNNPAFSGKHLKDEGITTSGNYYIRPNGYTGSAIECYVDMDVAGGGWVLCGAFASEANFEMRLNTGGKDASDVKNYATTAPGSISGGPRLLP